MGVWVTVEGETEYVRNCFKEIQRQDRSEPPLLSCTSAWHLIGLEVGMSVASVALRGEATGVATRWTPTSSPPRRRTCRRGDARRGGRLHRVGQAAAGDPSLELGSLPLGPRGQGRASGAEGHLSWADVAMDTTTPAYRLRRELEVGVGTPATRRLTGRPRMHPLRSLALVAATGLLAERAPLRRRSRPPRQGGARAAPAGPNDQLHQHQWLVGHRHLRPRWPSHVQDGRPAPNGSACAAGDDGRYCAKIASGTVQDHCRAIYKADTGHVLRTASGDFIKVSGLD